MPAGEPSLRCLRLCGPCCFMQFMSCLLRAVAMAALYCAARSARPPSDPRAPGDDHSGTPRSQPESLSDGPYPQPGAAAGAALFVKVLTLCLHARGLAVPSVPAT